MNVIERWVYDQVRDHPRLKRVIRDWYQDISSLGRQVTPVDPEISGLCVREGYFFGFHDKSPFSPDNAALLAHRELIPLRMPAANDPVEIGMFCGDSWREYRPLARTVAWNWHQGSMLQWLGGSGRVIFNDCVDNMPIARIVNIQGGEDAVLNYPIGAVSPDGKFAASYSFSRSNRGMPGYGYANAQDPDIDSLLPERDGLRIVHLGSGSVQTVLTCSQLAALDPDPSMEGRFHWVTHCQFSPSSQRLAFFHRWVDTANDARWTRLLTTNLDGSGLHIFPTKKMVSHYAWKDAEHILAYARTAAHDDHYYLFRDRTNEYSIVGENVFSSDGHPSFSPCGGHIITDTYPDRFRMQRLLSFHLSTGSYRTIGRFYSPRKFAGRTSDDNWTIDLHPRWDRKGSVICFDSGHTGTRSLCTLPFNGSTGCNSGAEPWEPISKFSQDSRHV